ncbi:MAG: hypothetical protein ABI969_13685 [bacterium]
MPLPLILDALQATGKAPVFVAVLIDDATARFVSATSTTSRRWSDCHAHLALAIGRHIVSETARVSPDEASMLFVESMMRDVQASWPAVRSSLALIIPDTLEERPALLDDPWTMHAITLARIGVEMQAVRHLLPTDVATRVLDELFVLLDYFARSDGRAAALVRTLDQRWTRATGCGANPTNVIGLTLFEYLDLDELIDVDGEEVINPVQLTGLSSVPIQMGLGWWKQFLHTQAISVAGDAI